MDMNFILSLCVSLVSVTAFVVSVGVLVNVTRSELKDFKSAVDLRFASVENRISGVENRISGLDNRLSALESDVAVIKAICQERSGQRSVV